jgi:hypothetical protein
MILAVHRSTAGEDDILFQIGDFIAQKVRRRIRLLLEGGKVPLQFIGENLYERRLGMGAERQEEKDNKSTHVYI